MLNQYKEIYKNAAMYIPDWEKKDKSYLINKYIEYKETNPVLADSYAAAVMYRYWGLVSKYLYMSNKSVNSEECMEWLIGAFMYTTEHKKWLDRDNKLYGDKNAPDKVLNRCMQSERQIFYQSSNYDVRKINYMTTSIQELEENELDYVIPGDVSKSNESSYFWIDTCISDLFVKHQYIDALVMYGITYGDVFNKQRVNKINTIGDFNKKKLYKYIKSLTNEELKVIGKTYADTIASETLIHIKETTKPFKFNNLIDSSLLNLRKILADSVKD